MSKTWMEESDRENRLTIKPVQIDAIKLPEKVCQNHDALSVFLGEPCPRCGRHALSSYDHPRV